MLTGKAGSDIQIIKSFKIDLGVALISKDADRIAYWSRVVYLEHWNISSLLFNSMSFYRFLSLSFRCFDLISLLYLLFAVGHLSSPCCVAGIR